MGLLSKAITVNPPASRLPANIQTVQEALQSFWRKNSSYEGIVLKLPKYAGETGFEKFFGIVTSIVASFGRTVRLPSKNILILFPSEQNSAARDRELVTHRLAKTLRTRALASFHAQSPGEVLSRIRPVI